MAGTRKEASTAVDAAGNQSRYGVVIDMDMTWAMVLAGAALAAAIGACIWYIHVQKKKIQVR